MEIQGILKQHGRYCGSAGGGSGEHGFVYSIKKGKGLFSRVDNNVLHVCVASFIIY